MNIFLKTKPVLIAFLIFLFASCQNPISSKIEISKSIVSASPAGDKKLVAYFVEWGIYDSHNNYFVMDMPLDKLTHINYSFVRADEYNNLQILDPNASLQKDFGDGWNSPYSGNLGQLIKAKELYPHLKTVISVGGWTKGDQFHRIAKTSASRTAFAANCVDFIRKWNFDGVDIDWEYPGINRAKDPNDQYDLGCPGGPEDEFNYTYLLRDIRTALDGAMGLPLLDREGNVKTDGAGNVLVRTEPYILSIASSAGKDKMELVHPEDFVQYLDYINIMGYDMHGSWDKVTGHNAPLYINPADTHEPHIVENYNVHQAVNMYLHYNIPASKLNLGVPFYSRGWGNVTPGNNNGLFSSGADASLAGIWGPGGQNPYYTIKTLVNQGGWIRYWDNISKVPWLYHAVNKQMLTYDDSESLIIKTEYAMSRNLGGIMIWEIDADSNHELTNAIFGAIGSNPDTKAPTIPTGLIAGASTESTVSLSWTASTDSRAVAGYKVFLNDSNREVQTVSNTSTTVTGLIGGTAYTVKVSAYDAAGNESEKSLAISLTTRVLDTQSPAVPSGLTVNIISASEINLSWIKSVDYPSGIASGYDVYMNGASELTVNSNSANITGLNPLTTYSFKVRAFDSSGAPNYSAFSTAVEGTTSDIVGPATGIPKNPQLTKNAWNGESTYNVISNMWWGNNAVKAELYENRVKVSTKSIVDNSPNAQHIIFNFSNKANGIYEYYIVLTNSFGKITSSTFIITVTQGNRL